MVGLSFYEHLDAEAIMPRVSSCLVDDIHHKLYRPSDFLRSESKDHPSLYWNILGPLRNNARSGKKIHATGGIDTFLSSLLDHLVKKKLFSVGRIGDRPCIGDYLIDYVDGISIDLSSAHEMVGPSDEVKLHYFPRKKEDAEAIAKSFFSQRGPVLVTQVSSLQNIGVIRDPDTDISRESYDSSSYVKKILERNKRIRAYYSKNPEDKKFVNAEY